MDTNTQNKQKVIVVVEDSQTQASQIKQMLESEGLRVITAVDGLSGLGAVRENIPDAIVLDLEMPGMNGLEVCQQLKAEEKTCNIPVIIFTRHDERNTVVAGLTSGAIEFIPKDVFASDVLRETLRQMGMISGESRLHKNK